MQCGGSSLKYCYLLALSLFLLSCSKAFQPMAPEYRRWSKPNTTELDVRKSLLECGYPSPNPTLNIFEHALESEDMEVIFNVSFAADLCMEYNGYTYHDYTVEEYCSWKRYKHLAICQPGAKIPKPSIERRLNSWYCKISTDYQYCLEHAVNPPACDPEEYNPPPPECLP